MTLSKDIRILIVGLGVIGGSYARALTERGYTVDCITEHQEDIDYAIEHGILREGTTEVDRERVRRAQLVVFALYPTVFVEWIKQYQSYFSPGTVITDVTGVKSAVVEEIQTVLRPDVEFIAAHPMAGRERSGVMYSDPAVFRGANYIVTPTECNTREAIELCKALGHTLGFARISELSVGEHDKMIAFLSQLTHCIAVSLMTCNETADLEKYTGDSFRDLTRIAKINDAMWSELFMLNRAALLPEMDRFLAEFSRFRNMLAEGDVEGMREKMRASTARRARFDKPSDI